MMSLLTLLSRLMYAVDYIWMAELDTTNINACSLGCAATVALTKLIVVVNSSVNIFIYLIFAK